MKLLGFVAGSFTGSLVTVGAICAIGAINPALIVPAIIAAKIWND